MCQIPGHSPWPLLGELIGSARDVDAARTAYGCLDVTAAVEGVSVLTFDSTSTSGTFAAEVATSSSFRSASKSTVDVALARRSR
mmetsp:Transcript_36771/g.107731  ORF Transcript_36771/g.107731 Transcript_36771/m.107731 type:complete len:84 (-) Transcript_36771:111-362(-)